MPTTESSTGQPDKPKPEDQPLTRDQLRKQGLPADYNERRDVNRYAPRRR